MGCGKSKDMQAVQPVAINVVSLGEPTPEQAQAASADDEEDAKEKRRMQSFVKKKRDNIVGVSSSEEDIKSYKPPSFPKSDAAKAKIIETMKGNEKMQILGIDKMPDEHFQEMIMAFQEKQMKQGIDIIKQGDDGDSLYVVESGSFDILVARKADDGSLGEPTKVSTFGPGSLFGELAILYDAPRAATVRCATPEAVTWSLDREPFQMLLKKCGFEKVQAYSGWLLEVDILKVLNHHEISQLADSCESVLFEKDEVIIKQGDEGDAFYILEEGQCVAFFDVNGEEKVVKTYAKQGEYFGELALLNTTPRKANVKATCDTSVLKVESESFMNLLGPIKDRLQTQASNYPQYADFLK